MISRAREGGAKRLHLIARVHPGKARFRDHVRTVKRAGVDMQFHRNAGTCQAARIFEIFFEQEIERTDTDEGRRQAF